MGAIRASLLLLLLLPAPDNTQVHSRLTALHYVRRLGRYIYTYLAARPVAIPAYAHPDTFGTSIDPSIDSLGDPLIHSSITATCMYNIYYMLCSTPYTLYTGIVHYNYTDRLPLVFPSRVSRHHSRLLTYSHRFDVWPPRLSGFPPVFSPFSLDPIRLAGGPSYLCHVFLVKSLVGGCYVVGWRN
ncbi:hypothetical protein GGS23DRAFT_27462 [Durotheca rogersii]|uniref:uncharacterized protein n=1 Tax=Durotheca rogersii TaxID=419775 RepID=UPI00221EF91D|nr:uncharacterized protein GGS23DRAFT_27462 [Durotheca rogersii]KAI5868389.1 hypothetical protein GGS23DRAFT_27462 [Durotheca rogersii]